MSESVRVSLGQARRMEGRSIEAFVIDPFSNAGRTCYGKFIKVHHFLSEIVSE